MERFGVLRSLAHPAPLRRLRHREIDPNLVVRQDDPPILDTLQKAGSQQGVNVAVHRLEVAADSPRHGADRHRALAGERTQELEAAGAQDLPQELDRHKGDHLALALAATDGRESPPGLGGRGRAERHGPLALSSPGYGVGTESTPDFQGSLSTGDHWPLGIRTCNCIVMLG